MLLQLLKILASILALIGAWTLSYIYLPQITHIFQNNAPLQVVPTTSTSTTKKAPVNPLVVALQPQKESTVAPSPAKEAVVAPSPVVATSVLDTPIVKNTVVAPGPLRATTTTSANPSDLTVAGVVVYTNEARAQNGNLPALKENFTLDRDAQMKLDDMFAKQYFEHVSPTGVGPSDLAQVVGYAYVTVGENLALGNFGSDQGVVTAWMNSPGHRANILNTHYQEIGVAVGKGMYEGRETWLAVQSFGMPLSACPSIDANLKIQIDANNTDIASLRAQLDAKKAQIDATSTYDKNYNIYVNEFNAIVPQYNSLVETNRVNVSTYNAGVQAFNACIGSVGASSATSTAH